MTEGNIDAKTLREMLERGEPVMVADVRKGEERAEWSIPGSVHFDAYDALNAGDEQAMEGLEVPEGTPVVNVCGRGHSSAVAAEQLGSRGIEAVSLEGGMQAWSLAWNTAEVPVEGSEASVIQVRRMGKGCLSYVVGSDGEATVIDALLEPDVYLGLAEERNWKVTRAFDTHVHADHLSRSRKLAELAEATLHMLAGSPVSYPFSALEGGDVIEIGAARIEALRTPGHTPQSTSYLLDGRALFSGDTLFLESVARTWGPPGRRPRGRRERYTGPCSVCSSSTPGRSSCPDTRAKPFRSRGSRSLLSWRGWARTPRGCGKRRRDSSRRSRALCRPRRRTTSASWSSAGPGSCPRTTELEAGANRCAAG